MKVIAQYEDGSCTILLEKGDRVRLLKDHYIGTWKTDNAGEMATVITAARPDEKFPTIAFIDVQTDRAKAGGWGVIHVAPWDVEFVESEAKR